MADRTILTGSSGSRLKLESLMGDLVKLLLRKQRLIPLIIGMEMKYLGLEKFPALLNMGILP